MTRHRTRPRMALLSAAVLFALSQLSSGQSSAPLLRVQISNAELQIEVSRQGQGNNINDIARSDNPRDVMRYPSTGSCVSVFNNGHFIFQKIDERDLGHPKVKSVEGTLTVADMDQLRTILDNDDLSKIKSPPPPDLPSDTVALREIERLDAQINHGGTIQTIVTVKERVKTNGSGLVSSAPSNGADTFLDNGAPYKKTLRPLMNWFTDFSKKNKSGLTESVKAYCGQ